MHEDNKTLGFNEVTSEIHKVLEKNSLPDEQVELSYERDEFFVRIYPQEIDEKTIYDIIVLAKKYIENWRIHTFDKNYVSLQALNSSIFQTDKMLENIKIRVSALTGERLIEITKKGHITPAELNLILNCIKQFCIIKYTRSVDQLAALGCVVYHPDQEKITMNDFAGYASIKKLIMETVVLPVKNPEVYDKITRSTRKNFESTRPKAVLFSGPPGVGKTTMARILARETGYHLVYLPLENIMSAYYGESSKRLALIFDVAAKDDTDKIILFLDEIDALAPSRNEKLFEATRRMLSVLLRKIDGIESKKNYITIGATNRKEDIDEALMSRFDTVIDFPLPDKEDIRCLLGNWAVQLGEPQKIAIANKMAGLSPRTIKDICNRAERTQARLNIELKSDSLPDESVYLEIASQYGK